MLYQVKGRPVKRNLLFVVVAIGVFILLNVAFTAAFSETPNDPTLNPDANACYTGGSMAGTCNTDYLWIAGWYAIRLQFGTISASQIPDTYQWLIPALPQTTEEPRLFPTNPPSAPTLTPVPFPTNTGVPV